MTDSRTPTPVDALADRHLDDYAVLNPLAATYFGIAGHDGELPAYTPDWYAQLSQLRRRTLAELAAATPLDASDAITVAALREELEVAEALREIDADESCLRNLASPPQDVRDIFDLTPTATEDDWAVVAQRLRAVPGALGGYVESLRAAASRGEVVARRQVDAAAAQCDSNAGADGFFATFTTAAAPTAGGELPESLRAELRAAGEQAASAYSGLAEFLREELRPQARAGDPVGIDRYRIHSRSFLGTQVDLAETYAWGQAEVARIVAEMASTAQRIKPGATVAQALEFLDADPGRKLQGTQALQEWMQAKSDEAIEALGASHFDIPEPIRRLECRIAPTAEGGIYYTGPSEDLVSRPGRMWWSVPEGVTEFATWRELTTVYHEGVPGHHLQIAQTVYRSDSLNRWRRLASWVSGHGEGWALYAERLMADLGYLDDPAEYLGMLDAQVMRAARVVLDIGIHCGFDAPDEVGGGSWDYDKAWAYLTAHSSMAHGFLRFELDRYLGWPGQAPAYKIGERLWLQLREDARKREGDAFDLTAFHRRALDIGSVGLDVLRGAVLGEFDQPTLS